MNAYVVSLKESPRYSNAEKKLRNSQIVPTKWIAVRGTDLSQKQVESVPTLDAQMAVIEKKPSGNPNRMTLGALGCALSHRALWAFLIQESDKGTMDSLLIFEDDVDPQSPFLGSEVENLVKEAGGTSMFDILLLHYWTSPRFDTVLEPYSKNLQRSRGVTYSFLGYIISSRGARKLLEKTMPIQDHIDVMMSFVARRDPSFVCLVVKNASKYIMPDFSFKSSVYDKPEEDKIWRGRAEEITANPLGAAKELELCRSFEMKREFLLQRALIGVVLLAIVFCIVCVIVGYFFGKRSIKKNMEEKSIEQNVATLIP